MKFIPLILVLGAVGLGLYKYQFRPTSSVPSPSVTTQNSPAPTVETGWKKYTDKTLGVQFFLPEEFSVEQNGQQSVMAKHPRSVSKVGDVEFFYITVVPPQLQDNESGEAYNYSRSFYNKLQAIGVGSSANLSELEAQKEWYNYERLPDQTIAGITTRVFRNRKPWEFPAGVSEYRYSLSRNSDIVLIGGYLNENSIESNLSLPTFTKIVNSVNFTQ